jgi:hypothetical protein
MKIEECIKCGAFVDATDAPPGSTIYCSDCYPKQPKPIERKVRSVPHHLKRIPGVSNYKKLEDLPEGGRWVTVEEATNIFEKHKNTIPMRIRAGRYKMAYVNGMLYIDLTSYSRKKYEKIIVKGIQIVKGRCICAVEDGMHYRQCNGNAIYTWEGKKNYCMKHFSDLKKGKSPKTIYDLEKK